MSDTRCGTVFVVYTVLEVSELSMVYLKVIFLSKINLEHMFHRAKKIRIKVGLTWASNLRKSG